MNQEFGAEALCVNDKAFGTIRSEADDLTNDSITRHPDRRKMAFSIEAGSEGV